jgi:hypothetical protein
MKIFFFVLLVLTQPSFAKTIYKLEFHSAPPLDFSAQSFELSPIYLNKVGTNGSLIDIRQLEAIREFKNNEIEMSEGETKIIGLVLKCKSGMKADFFVAPHEIHPGTRALDFKFDCLCYHHAYHMEKGKMWYRILKLYHTLDANKNAKSPEIITLRHEAQPWKNESLNGK